MVKNINILVKIICLKIVVERKSIKNGWTL